MTPNVFVAGEASRISHSGAVPENEPSVCTWIEPERDRAHRECDDQRLDLIAVADLPGEPAEDAGRRRRAIRIATTNETFHFSLSTLTTSALETMKPEIERSKPPIRISSVCPTEASPASDGEHEDLLDAAPVPEAEVDRAVGEDRDQQATAAGTGSEPAGRTSRRQVERARLLSAGARPELRSCRHLGPPGDAAEDDREDEHAAVHDLQVARIDLERDAAGCRAGRSRRRRASSPISPPRPPRGMFRRAPRRRSRAACTSTRGSGSPSSSAPSGRGRRRRRTARRARRRSHARAPTLTPLANAVASFEPTA